MLVSYKLKNFRSFKNEALLDFQIPSSMDKKTLEDNPFAIKIGDNFISKLCILYGHNGSGKSNIIRSLQKLLWHKISNLFDPYMDTKTEQSEFEVRFYASKGNKIDQRLYTYILILDNQEKKIHSEVFKHGDTLIFERDNSGKIFQGAILKDNNLSEVLGIPDTASVFRYMLREKKEFQKIIKKYFHVFRNIIPSFDISIDNSNNSDIATHAMNDLYTKKPEVWIMFKKLIQLADVGIMDLSFEQSNPDIKKHAEIEKRYTELKGKKTTQLKAAEKMLIILFEDILNKEQSDFQNKIWMSTRKRWKSSFDKSESTGTKTYTIELLNIVQSLYSGCLSIHDEINGVQSDLIKFMIFLFRSNLFPDIPNTAQLIMATHDTNIMSTKDILPHHIWFVNKKDDFSDLYSASAYKEITTATQIEGLYKENKLEAKYESHTYAIPLTFKGDS